MIRIHPAARNKGVTGFVSAVVLFCFALLVSADTGDRKEEPLRITSDSMVAEKGGETVIFRGNVVAVRGDVTLSSDVMTVHFEKEKEVKHITAEGRVRLLQGDKEIRAGHAEYFPGDEKVVFTDKPVFRDGKTRVSGSSITYFIKTEKSIVRDSTVILK